MKDTLNARIKHREMFRSFAPSVFAGGHGRTFREIFSVPFMTQAYSVCPEQRDAIPAPACGWHRASSDGYATGQPALLAAHSRL